MEKWLSTCLLLCLFGFFKELRPSEPFITEYLISPPMNLTLEETYYDVYPVWTYSYLSLLVVVFLLTDLLRYKPMLVFEGIGYVVTWCLLLWGRGVQWMQVMQFCYGIATSTEVAYFTYIYAQVSIEHYQKVTSFTRAAFLFGRFMSGVLAQILVATHTMSYRELNYITISSVSVALVIACILPSVRTSIYFHRKELITTTVGESTVRLNEDSNENTGNFKRFVKVIKLIWGDFKDAYSNRYLLKWSIWWAFATCGNFQTGNFIQPLWETISPVAKTEHLFNGLVEALSTLTGASLAFVVGYLHLNWSLFGEGTMAIISLIDGLLLLFMGLTQHIWVSYVNYIIFRASYQVMITIASYQVAKELRVESYGLVFGINMFLALFLQSLLTLIVVQLLHIEPQMQFVIYGSYFIVLALFFFVLTVYNIGRMGLEGIKQMGIWEVQEHTDRQEPPVGPTEAA